MFLLNIYTCCLKLQVVASILPLIFYNCCFAGVCTATIHLMHSEAVLLPKKPLNRTPLIAFQRKPDSIPRIIVH